VHIDYVKGEASKQIEQQAALISSLQEQLKAAKQSKEKRSYSIYSKGNLSSQKGKIKDDYYEYTSSAYLSPRDEPECPDEQDELNRLRRLIAHYRGACKRHEI
jgi:hypothetical protein